MKFKMVSKMKNNMNNTAITLINKRNILRKKRREMNKILKSGRMTMKTYKKSK